MTTTLDVVARAASDSEFSSWFAKDAIGAARAIGLQDSQRDDGRYREARLRALAQPLEGERTEQQLQEASTGMATDLGLRPRKASVEAARALFFVRDYRFHQRLLNGGEPDELERLVGRVQSEGSPPRGEGGTLFLTLHYGPFPLLWLWFKHAQARGTLAPISLLYDTRLYTPDVPPEQYARLAKAGTVPPERRDIDLREIGVRAALREAVARLQSGEIVLMFPDAFAVSGHDRALVCRLGRLEIAYPRGAVWLAQATRATVQGAVIRASGDGHAIFWGRPRTGPVGHEGVTGAVQDLFDGCVARDPAAWLAWTDEAAQPDV